jgi:hypothetical protein
MKSLSRLLLAPTLAAVLLLACAPTKAARRVDGSAYDGTWSVAIYTQRGDCSSVRVATRIVGGRVYSDLFSASPLWRFQRVRHRPK